MKLNGIFALILVCALLLCGCEDPNMGDRTDPTDNSTSTPSTQLTTPTKPSSQPAGDGKQTYTVTILDQNGDPVENALIQFCDDQNCKLPVATDSTGTVSASYAESEYHITLVELPAGYTSEETVFYFEDSNELTITVTAES